MLKYCRFTLLLVSAPENETIFVTAFGDIEKPVSRHSNFADGFARCVRINIIHTVMKFDQPLVRAYRAGQYVVNDAIFKSLDVHFQYVGYTSLQLIDQLTQPFYRCFDF